MNLINFFNIVRILSAFLLILFSVFLLNQKKGQGFGLRFLAGFLLARAGILIGMLFWSYKLWMQFPHVAYLETPLLFLYAPFLYLYSRALTISGDQWKRTDYLHFLPALLVLAFLMVRFYIHGAQTKLILIQSHSVYQPLPPNIISLLLWPQFLAYATSCLVLLLGYRSRIKSYYSSLEKINLLWLQFLLSAFFIWKGIFLTGYLFLYLPDETNYIAFCTFIEIGFLLYASLIVYKGLQQPEIFRANGQQAKYKTSPLKDEDKQKYLERIETYLKTHKLYLNPNLTLKELSQSVSIPTHYISQVLNDTREQKF